MFLGSAGFGERRLTTFEMRLFINYVFIIIDNPIVSLLKHKKTDLLPRYFLPSLPTSHHLKLGR